MSEVSICLFKKTGSEFKVYNVPITENEEILGSMIDTEENKIKKGIVKDYLKVFSGKYSNKLYFKLDENAVSEDLNGFIKTIILDNSQIVSIANFKPRKNSKDKLPFNGLLILKRDTTGNFSIGINSLGKTLKLYTKGKIILKICKDEYKVSKSDSSILIPNYVTILIKGKWDSKTISNLEVYYRSTEYQFFERVFNYRDLWKSKATNLRENKKSLNIDDNSWNEFNRDLRNTRKFVRCFNSCNFDEGIGFVKSYAQLNGLKQNLEFIKQGKKGMKININSMQDMQTFLDAFQKHIFILPIEDKGFYRADHPEKMNLNKKSKNKNGKPKSNR